MLVIPAIDVRGGATVRLRQGDYARETVYRPAPEEVVRVCAGCGARRVHIVDLDAARGRPDPDSRDAVRRALAAAREQGCEAQIGGGVRTPQDARDRIDEGATHVVVGSVAVQDPAVALAICEATPGRVLLALDVRAGRAQVRGWTEASSPFAAALAAWREWPVAGVVYTDTERDGMLGGPDLEGLDRCREVFGGPVFLSGGVSDLDDIRDAAAHRAAGVVVGRALLDGRIDLRRAIDTVAVAP